MFQPVYLEETLQPHLKKLEEERLIIAAKVSARTKAVVGTCLGLLAALLAYQAFLWQQGFPLVLLLVGALVAAIVLLIVGSISYVLLTGKLKKNYEKTIKGKLYEKALRNYNPTIEYYPQQHIEESAFKKAGLFGGFNRFGGDDLCTGKLADGRSFRFSELKVYRKSKNTGSSGSSKTKTVTIFEGLFYEMQLPQSVEVAVRIVPDRGEAFGAVGKFMQGMLNKALKAFSLEDPLVDFGQQYPNFEHAFKVYCKEERVARQLISPDFVEKITALNQDLGGEVYLAFQENHCYWGVRRGDFLKVNLQTSLLGTVFLDQLEENLDWCFDRLRQLDNLTTAEKGSAIEGIQETKIEEEKDRIPPQKTSVSYKKSNSKDNPFLL